MRALRPIPLRGGDKTSAQHPPSPTSSLRCLSRTQVCSELRRTRAGRVRYASKLIHPRRHNCEQRRLAPNLLALAQRAARVDGEGKLPQVLQQNTAQQNGAHASAAALERSVSKLRRGCEAAQDELHKVRHASTAPRCSSQVAPSQVTPSQVTPSQVTPSQVGSKPGHPQAKSPPSQVTGVPKRRMKERVVCVPRIRFYIFYLSTFFNFCLVRSRLLCIV